MKIVRDGKEYELTDAELFDAYAEQEHRWDVNYIKDRFGDNEEFDRLTAAEKEDAIDEIAYDFREILNDMEFPDAFEAASNAVDEFFGEFEYPNDWICVYKDALGYEDDYDNLTDILVPLDWLKAVLESEGEEDIEGWWDEYTADSTDYIARAAVAQGKVLKCDDEKVAAHLGVAHVASGPVACAISNAMAKSLRDKAVADRTAVDLTGYELMSGRVDGFDIYRKILRNKDGDPVMGVWAAAKEGVEAFAISYEQARGEAAIEPSGVKELGRKLGELLLP